MPATDDSSYTPCSSPVFSFTQSADSVTSSESMEQTVRTRRYPAHLSHGSPSRKPHLNSNRYEAMEDLLAAAGYSVTRVITPKTERAQKMDEGVEESGIGNMFAGLIAHLLPTTPTSGSSKPTSPVTGSNPLLAVHHGEQYPQATRSLRTHLTSLKSPHAPDPPNPRSQPALRHVTSAPSLPRVVSGRRRGLPSAWRDPTAHVEPTQPPKTSWSGGFVPKQTDAQLKSRKNWFGTVTSESTVRARSGSQPPRASHTLRPPHMIHRTRSAPRLNKVHVPAPAPPIRPSPVVQPNVVVCRSVSSLGSSSSVQTRSSVRSKSRSSKLSLALQSDDDEPESPCLVLTPESAHPDGLPSTPARPTLVKQRSARFLRRGTPQPVSLEEEEPEPDLAAIIDAFRPLSPARRQRSIKSLRALLKDPKFPDVPVVCVASPGTVSAGGPGKALWIRDSGWDATVRK